MDGYAALTDINARLWDLENRVRSHEARQSFGRPFLHTITLVQQLNKTRAEQRATAHQAVSRLLGTDDQSIPVETSIDEQQTALPSWTSSQPRPRRAAP